MSNCPEDIIKTKSNITSAPADLGGGTEHTYFLRRRSGCTRSDIYSFDDVFPVRNWHHAVVPSAASLILRQKLKIAYPYLENVKVHRNIYKKISFVQGMPLSEEG